MKVSKTWFVLLAFAFSVLTFAQDVKFDSDTISGLGARNIGSATMSGRIAAVDAVNEGNRLTVYVGAASGGVWKSVNGGTTFKPVFDKYTQSIGAITIDPGNPKIIWVGAGEAWTRNSTSVGDGVYRSTDGGENWTHLGLKDSERISRILVDPKDGNTALVCAVGHLWNDNDERGVYKTTDAGKTWKKVLGGSNGSTGCGIMSSSPQDPKTIFASLWDFRRKGWTFRSGGEGPDKPSGSGLYKSTDGGDTWTEVTGNGMPAKPYGRIAVAVAPSKANIVYAMVESAKSGLFRSDDGGKTWTAGDASQLMVWRPFYFAKLIVDPNNDQKVYKVDLGLIVSTDGGKSFSGIAGAIHGDFHDVWVNPKNTDFVIATNDGGAGYTMDGGNRWTMYMNLPVSQFYHVSVDNHRPFRVYGGLQDNSSWVGETDVPGGIGNKHWENMFGGDGFWMFEDTSDPDYLYAEAQGGEIGRVNRHTHETRFIKPQPAYKEDKLRFNWNTPIHMSPNHKGWIYIGSQYLHRSKDHGATWEKISPDLTTNDPEKQKQEESGGITVDNSAAEMHTTIFSISESPKNGDVIWVGTDDGNIQVTRDGGKSWTKASANLTGLPRKDYWVTSVEAGRYDEGTAFATIDGHTFGDMKPYIYKTTDYGQTWTSLISPGATKGDSPQIRGYAYVIKEDTVRQDLLFAGTEFGLFISLDNGHDWAQYKGGDMPNASVRDLAIQARDNALAIATHGRGIWIIDDLRPLRALTPEVLAQDFAFINIGPITQRLEADGGWADGDSLFTAPNPKSGALITYYQKKRHIFGDLILEVVDKDGKVLSSTSGNKRRGLSQAEWMMRLKAPRVPPAASALFQAASGPRVLPGKYTVRMIKGDKTYTTEIDLVPDPRAPHTGAERKLQFDTAVKISGMFSDMSYLVDKLVAARNGARDRAGKLTDKDPSKKKLEAFANDVDKLRSKIVATKEGGAITGEERIREHLGEIYGVVAAFDGGPTDYQLARMDAMGRELGDVSAEFDKLVSGGLNPLNAALARKKLDPVPVLSRADWDKKISAEGGGKGDKKEQEERRSFFERD